MKRFSKSVIAFLMIVSLTLLASCDKENDNKENNNGGNNSGFSGDINTEGGLEGPIIPWN